jgi:hypothetical protein
MPAASKKSTSPLDMMGRRRVKMVRTARPDRGQTRHTSETSDQASFGAKLALNRGRLAWLWMLLGIGATLVGCGKGDGAARLPVFGAVSLESGEKLSGSITFVPTEGHRGPAATTTLVDGNYRFDRSNGPTAGPHRVIVRRGISKSKILAGLADKKPKGGKPELATEPKMEWTVFVDVAENRIQCDFALEP